MERVKRGIYVSTFQFTIRKLLLEHQQLMEEKLFGEELTDTESEGDSE